jgi:hypothetical protein
VNPSTLSSSLLSLKALHEALVMGTCKFMRLTAAERKACEAAYMAKIALGEVELHKHKQKNDRGVRRGSKQAHKDVVNDEEDNDSNDKDKASHIPKS